MRPSAASNIFAFIRVIRGFIFLNTHSRLTVLRCIPITSVSIMKKKIKSALFNFFAVTVPVTVAFFLLLELVVFRYILPASDFPLRRFDNTFLTPHIGGSTIEAQENIGMEVAEKLARYSDNGTTTSSINLPAVALPEHVGSHRLLHIHRNVPGVMSAINSVFSENSINICAQFLQTNDTVGYVVIDIEAEYSEIALKKLAAIEGTIRSRVLF